MIGTTIQFTCKASVEDEIQRLAEAGQLRAEQVIGYFGEHPVTVKGRFRSRSTYPGLQLPMIRWVCPGMGGFFKAGLADLRFDVNVSHLPIVK